MLSMPPAAAAAAEVPWTKRLRRSTSLSRPPAAALLLLAKLFWNVSDGSAGWKPPDAVREDVEALRSMPE